MRKYQRDYHQHISRELHDRVGYEVNVAFRKLELLEHYRTDEPRTAGIYLNDAKKALFRAQEEIRRIICGAGQSLRECDFKAELATLKDLLGDSGADYMIVVVGDPGILPESDVYELFMILREGIRNSVRHSGADLIGVVVIISGDSLQASVRDNGCGFETERGGAGHGLTSMRERGSSMGGEVVVSSQPGEGTTITLRVPLKVSR